LSDTWIPCDCGDQDCPGYRLDDLGSHPFFVPFDKSQFVEESTRKDNQRNQIPFGIATTSSWEFDGERTDLNDMFAVLWGAYLRCAGICSVNFFSDRGFFISTEIRSRAVIPIDWGVTYENWPWAKQKLLLAKTSVHMKRFVYECFFHQEADSVLSKREPFESPPWLPEIVESLSLSGPESYELQTRQLPQWTCLSAIEEGLTVTEIPKSTAKKLRVRLRQGDQENFVSATRMAIKDDQLRNAVEHKVLKILTQVIATIDQSESEAPLVIAMASYVVGIGQRSIVCIATDCGRSAFNDELVQISEKRQREAEFFLTDVKCAWSNRISDDRFEELIGELVKAEKGVLRVRQVGNTREADDGRDFIAEWLKPDITSALNFNVDLTNASLSQVCQVLVQVKIRTKGVGRSDASGLRDTIEHHDCQGLLFVAFPNVTTTLNDHLQKLRRRGDWWVDWWNRGDIEDRLRRNTDIANRYPDVVVLETT